MLRVREFHVGAQRHMPEVRHLRRHQRMFVMRWAALFLVVWGLATPTWATDVTIKAVDFYDEINHRRVPTVLYTPENIEQQIPRPVIILNHGNLLKNTDYETLARTLAAQGYTIFAPQHQLDTDPALPTRGNLFEARKPFWTIGVNNILTILRGLPLRRPSLDSDRVILIGHSNGGDISMMFADLHPDRVACAISLDSLRYPFPQNGTPILSLRAYDTTADRGVLPETGARIINMPDAAHMDFCDTGPAAVQQEVAAHILSFLKEKKDEKAARAQE